MHKTQRKGYTYTLLTLKPKKGSSTKLGLFAAGSTKFADDVFKSLLLNAQLLVVLDRFKPRLIEICLY